MGAIARQRLAWVLAGLLLVSTILFATANLTPSISAAATNPSGLDPAVAADYVHRILAADRTVYAQAIVDRAQSLERFPQPQGVLNLAVRQDWERQNGLPIPCDLLRLGRDFADEDGQFTYGLISPWFLDDNHGLENERAKTAWKHLQQTGQPYRDYQTLEGQRHFTAFYPDRAVAQSCLDCHNRNPEHRSRYPEKTFQSGDLMGALWIDLPLQDSVEVRAE